MEPKETPPVEVPTPPPATPAPPPSVFSSPLLWLSIGIIILMMIGIAFYYFVSSRQHMTPVVVRPSITTVPTTIATPPTTEPTQSAQASPSATTSNLPPLFPGVEWEATESGEFTAINYEHEYISNLKGYSIKSKPYKMEGKNILSYYDKELLSRGWTNTDIAGEENYFYEKGDHYFVLTIKDQNVSEPIPEFVAFIDFN